MVFSSIIFLFYFLPVLLAAYFIVPKKLRNLVLIVGSLVFYAWGEIKFIPFLIGLSIEDYLSARMIEKYRGNAKVMRVFLFISVLCNLGILTFFKYTNFFVTNIETVFGIDIPLGSIMLPIGVSFNTFQSISYTADVYRGKIKAETNYYNYLTFTTLFPQIVAGPIVRYEIVGQELKYHPLTVNNFSDGMRQFISGLAKKVLIANTVGYLWSEISSFSEASVLLYWIGAAAYTLQIYFDFSGYSDMAVGLARVFGLSFDANFNYPYISKSITEFWRRWHITLGSWFRDYVYIPLGGNRCSKLKNFRNIMIVWALTGFWHGASWNFVIWGLYFAVLLIIEKMFLGKLLSKIPAFFSHLYTMLFVLISWMIFYFDDMGKLLKYLSGMFGLSGVSLCSSQALYYALTYAVIFAVGIYLSTPHFGGIVRRLQNSDKAYVSNIVTAAYILVFIICIAYLVTGTYNPFLYTRF